MKRVVPIIAACLALFAATDAGAMIERPIVLPPGEARLCLLSFRTGGKIDSAGRGVSVVDQAGNALPMRVVCHDPIGQTWLVFDRGSLGKGLRLRYDTRPIAEANRDADLTPSLLLTTYAVRIAADAAVDDVLTAVSRLKPLGAAPVDMISLAHHPFGPAEDVVLIFDGLVNIDKAHTARWFSVNDDAAFVALDNQWIITEPRRRVTRDSRQLVADAHDVKLNPGVHRLRYVLVQRDGRLLALLGRAQGKRAVPLPADAYVHQPVASLGPATSLEALGFDAQQIDQVAYEDAVYSRWRFTPIAPAGEGCAHRWAFGDGATRDGTGAIEHVFVGATADLGAFEVRLGRVKLPGTILDHATSTVRPTPMMRPRRIEDERASDDYADAILAADYSRASESTLAALYNLLWYEEKPAQVAPLAEVYVKRFASQGNIDPAAWRIQYALATHLTTTDAPRAARLFRALAMRAKIGNDTWPSACAAAAYLDVMIFNLDHGEEAARLAPRLAAGRQPRERSLLMARIGDVHRLAGRVDEAIDAYHRARRAAGPNADPKQDAVIERALREAAMDHLLHGRHTALRDALFRWEAEFPEAKIGGDLPLFAARYFQVIGDDRRAATELRSLLALNPLHPSRPEIVYRLGQSCLRLGDETEAAQWFGELTQRYPNSPFAKGTTQP